MSRNAEQERGHDGGAHAARPQAGEERVGHEHEDDGDDIKTARQAERLEREEDDRGEHGDVQTADDEEMDGAGALEQDLQVFRALATQAEHDAVNDGHDLRRIGEVDLETLLHPAARPERTGLERILPWPCEAMRQSLAKRVRISEETPRRRW